MKSEITNTIVTIIKKYFHQKSHYYQEGFKISLFKAPTIKIPTSKICRAFITTAVTIITLKDDYRLKRWLPTKHDFKNFIQNYY